jgi:cytochrome c peroxidase
MKLQTNHFEIKGSRGRLHASIRTKTLFAIILLLALTGAVAGCGSDGSGGLAAGGNLAGTPIIPTAPAGLPALVPDAGGPSNGLNIVASIGMTLPVVAVSPVPQLTAGTIIDQDAAIRLGKAFFWDMQTGSNGRMACASCHFVGGADNRARNTVNPGPDTTFQVVAGPGADFIFTTFDPALIDDVVGSSGVFSMSFTGIPTDLDDPVDICTPVIPANPGQALIAGAGERLVSGRNTPTTVGAVFFLDNLWDGLASHRFNGLNPLGTGIPITENGSLASQSVGAPLSIVLMSCAGRTFNGPNSLGDKLVLRIPLADQLVDPTDSVLGALSNSPGNGLDCGFGDRLCTYADLIAAAFGTNGLSGQEAVDFYINNFSSIWGQAVQAYEATLVPNRTPYDLGLLTDAQVIGLNAFRNTGCVNCHVEPEFSDATVRLITANGGTGVPKLINGQSAGDQGFHNIGASLTVQDRGRAAVPGGPYNISDFNEGAFKTPALRNVKLTAPYMHNGAIAAILDVIDFYNGQGQVDNPEIDPNAVGLNVGGNRDDVADFLENGLTDCRLEHELAPFDHPSLAVPNGPSLPAVGAAGNGNACP